MRFHVVLVEPEIPANTGNIARTCAVTGAQLHLVEPLGFDLSDRQLKRAGLDYWPELNVQVHKSLDEFFACTAGGVYYYCSTKAGNRHTDIAYPEECYLLFGKETKGLPEPLVFSNSETAVRIPMRESLRSLNLSNSVAIVLYEVLRQHGFPEMI